MKDFTSQLPKIALPWLLCLAILLSSCAHAQEKSLVSVRRVPGGGLQPQIVVQGATVHLLSFRGDPKAGDLFYARSNDGGANFGTAIRVNSQVASAVAMGTIRGGQLAVGRGGRVFVAWNGSDKAMPRNVSAPASKREFGAAPLLFTRLSAAGDAFEPQRNLLTKTWNLDGGADIAADDTGHVYLAWHANQGDREEEASRRVYLAVSSDDGATFAPEKSVWNQPTGACGCCALDLMAQSGGKVNLLYRSATEMVNRDTYFLASNDAGKSFSGQKLHPWNIGACPMSSFSLAVGPTSRLAAWETEKKVYFSPLDAQGKATAITPAPRAGENRKYPFLSVNRDGKTLLVWTQGTAWNQGGDLAWQAYDSKLRPIEAETGEQKGVPAWSFAAAFARPDGEFTVLY